MNFTGWKIRRKVCKRWWRSASPAGKIANTRNLRRRSRQWIDARSRQGIHSSYNLQARAAGKAVRFGLGPATVIGAEVFRKKRCKPGHPPMLQFAELRARGSRAVAPRNSRGIFVFGPRSQKWNQVPVRGAAAA